jgi:hypothetical protein
MTYITPQDIFARLVRRHPHWFEGSPKVELVGENHDFGTLSFDFGDEIVEYRLYIDDRDEILATAQYFIEHYQQMCKEEWNEYKH